MRPWVFNVAAVLWFVFLGPAWLVGWGVLSASKYLNIMASLWCRAIMALYPDEDSYEG